MSESADEEEPVLQELSPVRAFEEDRHEDDVIANLSNMEGADEGHENVEAHEHVEARPGSSQSSNDFGEVGGLSPSRDDDAPCPNCANSMGNTMKAFEEAANMSKLQAQYNDLNDKYKDLSKTSAEASMHVEDTYKKLKESETKRDRFEGELGLAKDEVARLQNLNRQYLEAASHADKHRQAADEWAKKHIQSQAVLLEKSEKYTALEGKFKTAVDSLKKAVADNADTSKKLMAMKDKQDENMKENRTMKKYWNVVVKLLADISSQCSYELPSTIRDRVNKLPFDALLSVARPTGDAADGSDDEAEQELLRLVNGGSSSRDESNFGNMPSPHKPRGGGRGRGRGSRGGRAQSMAAPKTVVDERMHDDMLARKLHRGSGPMESAPSEPAAKSVIGKKTETVREQQERQKMGMKDKMAQLKDERDAKEKEAVKSHTLSDAPASSPMDDMMLTDDDDHGFDIPDAEPVRDAPAPSVEYDMDMPEIGGPREEEEPSAVVPREEEEPSAVVPREEEQPTSMYDSVKRRRSKTPQPSEGQLFNLSKPKGSASTRKSLVDGVASTRKSLVDGVASTRKSLSDRVGGGGRTRTMPVKPGTKGGVLLRPTKEQKEQIRMAPPSDFADIFSTMNKPASKTSQDNVLVESTPSTQSTQSTLDAPIPDASMDEMPSILDATAASAADEATRDAAGSDDSMPLIQDESAIPAETGETAAAAAAASIGEKETEKTKGDDERREEHVDEEMETTQGTVHDPLRVEVSVESNEQPEEMAAEAAAAPSSAAILSTPPRPSVLSPPSKSPSPSKMIQHPKVIELSQQRPDAGLSPTKLQRKKEKLDALGLGLSDSDESDDEEEKEKEREREAMKKRELPQLPLITRPSLKSPSKSPQKSPLALEAPKPAQIAAKMMSPLKRTQLGLGARINKAGAATLPVPPPVVVAAASAAASSSSSTVMAAEKNQSIGGPGILDDILAGAHRTPTQPQKKGRATKQKEVPVEIEKEKEKEKEPEKELVEEPVEEPVEDEQSETVQQDDEILSPKRSRQAKSKEAKTPRTPKTPKKTVKRGREENEDEEGEMEVEMEEKSGRSRRQSTSAKKKKTDEEVKEAKESADRARRGRSVSRKSREEEEMDNEGAVSRRTRSKSVPPEEMRESTSAPPPPAQKTPSRSRKAPAKSPKTRKTPTKKAATPQRKVILPKSGLSDSSSEEEEESQSQGSSFSPKPRALSRRPSTTPATAPTRTSARMAEAAARTPRPAAPTPTVSSSGRTTRASSVAANAAKAANAASAAVTRRSSTSTRVEAVQRMDKQGTLPKGAAREAAARLREEADAAAAAAPAARPATRRATTVAAAARSIGSSQDDGMQFARSNRRTAMSAPRKAATASDSKTDSTGEMADKDDEMVDPTMDESVDDEEPSEPLCSPPKKRVARSATTDHVMPSAAKPAVLADAAPVVHAAAAPAVQAAAAPAAAIVAAQAASVDSAATELPPSAGVEEQMGEEDDNAVAAASDETVAAFAADDASSTTLTGSNDKQMAAPSTFLLSSHSLPTTKDDGELPEQILEDEMEMEPGSCIVEEEEVNEEEKKEEEEKAKEEEERKKMEEMKEEEERKEMEQERMRKEEEERKKAELKKEKEEERKRMAEEKKRIAEEKKRVAEEKREEDKKKREEAMKKKEEEKKRKEEEKKRKEEEKRIEMERKKEEDEKRKEEKRRIEEEKRLEDEKRKEASIPSTPVAATKDSDDEMGDLMIDDGPDSPPTLKMPSSPEPIDETTVAHEESVEEPAPQESTTRGSGKEPEWPVEAPASSTLSVRSPPKMPKLTPAVREEEKEETATDEMHGEGEEQVALPPAVIKRNFIKRPPTKPIISGGPLRGSAIATIIRKRQRRQSQSSSDGGDEDSITPQVDSASVASEITSEETTATVEDVAAAAPSTSAASAAQTMDEKKKALMAGLATMSSSRGGRGGSRGGGTGGRGGGRMTGGAGTTTNRAASIAGGSRTSAMESQIAKMAKNLRGGKSAMSGAARPTPAAAKTAAAGSSSRETTPPSQSSTGASTAAPAAATAPAAKSTAAVAAATKATAAAAGRKVAAASKPSSSDPRPRKRKAEAFSAVEAVAIRVPAVPARGTSTTSVSGGPSASSVHSAESNLISSITNVCMGKETVEKAVKMMDITAITLKTFVGCVIKAISELPQSNTWHVVMTAKSTFKSIEQLDRSKVIPKPERLLFELLMEVQEKFNDRLKYMFDTFFNDYCLVLMKQITSSNTTADITRSVRCLFFALFLSDRPSDEKEEEAVKFFVSIIKRKPSTAVCQSLVYLLCHPQTASLSSAVLRVELDDDEKGGRFLSMHMNETKCVAILNWAIDLFADESCKDVPNAAFRTPATKEMVNEWWDSDMEFVERAKENAKAVTVNGVGKIVFDSFNRDLINRMTMLLSPVFRIEGLDRVLLLKQLDVPAIDTIDRLTATRIEDTGSASMFADTSSVSRAYLDEGDARVIVLRLHIALGALSAFYADCMYGADQREELRRHLRDMVEKVHSILDRPACLDIDRSRESSPDGSQEVNALPMALIALQKWRDSVKGLTKHDLIGTPITSSAESSPVKKRARSEEYGKEK